jgi:cell division septation protein DedD
MDENLELEQEETTGTGRLLPLFLGMVVLCAVFFGLGYSLGKASAPTPVQAAEPLPAATGSGDKPSPLNAGDAATQANSPSTDQLTFYKSVEQKDDQPGLAAKPPVSEEARLAEAAGMTPVTTTTPAPAAPGYTVQIAAVTRREDANALVNALRKKSYEVFVADSAGDKLFRVQVGPFSDLKQAQAMKARLAGDGYKAIVKH